MGIYFVQHASVWNCHKNTYRGTYTSLHRQDVAVQQPTHPTRDMFSVCLKPSLLSVLAPSVRTQQTRWITQSWLWVTAPKRTARHIGLWRTLGARPGALTGKYSPAVCVCVCVCVSVLTVMTWSRFQGSLTPFLFAPSDIFWSSEDKTCADWLRALPTLYL